MPFPFVHVLVPKSGAPAPHDGPALQELADLLEASLLLPSAVGPADAREQLAAARRRVEQLEAEEARLRGRARARARLFAWGGLALLAGQWGLLFRLTFWWGGGGAAARALPGQTGTGAGCPPPPPPSAHQLHL